ncbi:MAG: hypothetical protein ROO76_15365 [Terriglobia bacterium]|jgi:hypothetical protein|nr:hypothetical protein [Terriglobia bacterium]
MQRTIRMISVVLALSLAAMAHGKPQIFMGVVKELSSAHIVITTTTGDVRKFEIGPHTKFLKSGQPAKASDLAAGERVVVEADVHGNKALAETVKFGKPSQGHQH